MLNFTNFINESYKDKPYGCLMINFDNNAFKDLVSVDENSINKKETESHITLIYGLHHEFITKESIKQFIKTNLMWIFDEEFIFNKLGLFEQENEDILIVKINNEKLEESHYLIRNSFPNHQTYLIYKPHLTIYYLKKSEGNNELTNTSINIKLKPTNLTYSFFGDNKLEETWTFNKKQKEIN